MYNVTLIRSDDLGEKTTANIIFRPVYCIVTTLDFVSAV